MGQFGTTPNRSRIKVVAAVLVVFIVVMVTFLNAPTIVGTIADRSGTDETLSINIADIHTEVANTTPSENTAAPPSDIVALQNDADIIEFPDGEEVTVFWHLIPLPNNRPDPPYLAHYDRLRSEAEAGNPASAFALWSALGTCNFAPESEADLSDALDKLNQSHMIQTVEMSSPQRLPNIESVQTWEKMLNTTYNDCLGITAEQKNEKILWLEIAASNNYPIAMLEYSKYVTDFADGVAIDTARWQAGDSQGLNDLARRYENKYQSGDVPEYKIAAAAHLYAFIQLAQKRYDREGAFYDPRFDLVKSRQAELVSALLPHELDEAISAAKEIIKSNSSCCFSF